MWVPPVYQQLTASGQGNLSAVVHFARHQGGSHTTYQALIAVGHVLVMLP